MHCLSVRRGIWPLDAASAGLLAPAVYQLSASCIQHGQWGSLLVIENHQCVDPGQIIHFRRQRAFFTGRRALRAPVVDDLLEFGQGDIHGYIVRLAPHALKGLARDGLASRQVEHGMRIQSAVRTLTLNSFS